jgi:hypothetical protein
MTIDEQRLKLVEKTSRARKMKEPGAAVSFALGFDDERVGTVPRTIAEADWKVLRRLHPLALERFCERVLAEIERVTHLSAQSAQSAQSAHQRYLDIFKTIEQRDREIASIFDDPKRSNALTMLARMRSEGLLMEDEFSSLSPETRGAIQLLLGAE